MQNLSAPYTPCDPRLSDYYRCVEDYFEELERIQQEADTLYRKKCRANWARLIQKIYETDPLTCPNCKGVMRILAFIEEEPVIRQAMTVADNVAD